MMRSKSKWEVNFYASYLKEIDDVPALQLTFFLGDPM